MRLRWFGNKPLISSSHEEEQHSNLQLHTEKQLMSPLPSNHGFTSVADLLWFALSLSRYASEPPLSRDDSLLSVAQE